MEEEAAKMEKLSSAAAFVEGGVQDACDDTCSICLDAFCDSNPSTVTNCKHEFHLQCMLEWCQRSSHCPMCWQAISMKDPLSQELLEAVEHERNVSADRATTHFHHPLLGDFEVPVGADGNVLEEHIMQHFVAAAASRRSHRHGRREGRRGRSGAQGHPQIVVSSATEATSNEAMSSDSCREGDTQHPPATISTCPLAPVVSAQEASADASAHHDAFSSCNTGSDNSNQSSSVNQDRAGPSDLQSFSDTLKIRLQSVSTKYKDSITNNTRGWKEGLLAKSNTISNLGSDMRREVNAGIAAVSRMMEMLETKDGSGSDGTGPSSTSPGNGSGPSSALSGDGTGPLSALPADASDTNNHQMSASSYFGTASVNNASSSATYESRSGSQ